MYFNRKSKIIGPQMICNGYGRWVFIYKPNSIPCKVADILRKFASMFDFGIGEKTIFVIPIYQTEGRRISVFTNKI